MFCVSQYCLCFVLYHCPSYRCTDTEPLRKRRIRPGCQSLFVMFWMAEFTLKKCLCFTGFRLAPQKPRRVPISASWLEIHALSCPVMSCPPDSRLSYATKQYWPEGHPLTNLQWVAVKRNRLCESGFSFLTTSATETVKWNSQVTVNRDSGARREAERGRAK